MDVDKVIRIREVLDRLRELGVPEEAISDVEDWLNNKIMRGGDD